MYNSINCKINKKKLLTIHTNLAQFYWVTVLAKLFVRIIIKILPKYNEND